MMKFKDGKILIKSEKEMRELARREAERVLKEGPIRNKARVVALQGELGSGKSVFARAFLRALGVRSRVISPTFVLIKRYKLAKGLVFKQAYHVDAYRLNRGKELLKLGWEEVTSNSENVVLLEWPERVNRLLTSEAIRYRFYYGEKEKERLVLLN